MTQGQDGQTEQMAALMTWIEQWPEIKGMLKGLIQQKAQRDTAFPWLSVNNDLEHISREIQRLNDLVKRVKE